MPIIFHIIKFESMKSQDKIQATLKNLLNNSVSKQQFSFSRQPRFIDRLALAKTILDKFYDVNAERCKLGGFFSKSKRVTTEVKEDSPSPDHYNPKIIDIKKSVSFHAGRQQCKLESMFYTTTAKYPGPGNYDPQKTRSSSCIYMGKRLNTSQGTTSSPGPIYQISTSLLDKEKVLSNHKRKGTIKIMLPSCKSRMRKNEFPDLGAKKLTENAGSRVLNRLGNRVIGKSGVFFSIEKQRRFLSENKEKSPGPGHYPRFSDFIPNPTNS